MITSHRNSETGIIESKYEGRITLQDIISYISELKDIGKYPKKILILSDATAGRLELGPDDEKVFATMIRQYAPHYELIKDAVIISDPKSTAYSLLFRSAAASIPNYQMELFNTREAAIRWLLG